MHGLVRSAFVTLVAVAGVSAQGAGIEWGSYVGGTGKDEAFAVEVAANGEITIAGSTLSADFPTTPGAFDTTYNGSFAQPWLIGDVFVARLSADGTELLWATYIGGSENERLTRMKVMPNGDVIVSGWTTSVDYPVTPGAFDLSFNGTGQGYQFSGGDLFVTRLSANGSSLVYSTFIGGTDLEYTDAMDVDAEGNVTLTGHVHSLDFPTTPGAHQNSMRGFSDSFVTRLDATGSSLVFSTYFGGTSAEEYGKAMVVDRFGRTTIGGPTDSTTLPVTPGAFQSTFNGGTNHFADGFLARFDAAGGLDYCTYLGTAGNDIVQGLAVDANDDLLITGETDSPGFPVTGGAFDPTHNGQLDAFVCRFDPETQSLIASTYLGGSTDDSGIHIVDDGSGAPVVTLRTDSTDVPTTAGSRFATLLGQTDAYVARLAPDLGRIEFASYLGSTGWEQPAEIAVRRDGAVACAGAIFSSGFPAAPGVYDPSFNGAGDAFVGVLDLLPTGVARVGAATAGCLGEPFVSVNSMAAVGNVDFAFTSGRATPGIPGALALGTAPAATPVPLLGAALWVDPAPPFFVLPTGSTLLHGAAFSLPLPNDAGLVGATLVGQFLWVDGCGPLGATTAISATIQP